MSVDDRTVLEDFVIESRELLACAETNLVEMERSATGGARADVSEVFRAVHTVKGAAGYLGLNVIGRLSHAMESLLAKVRDGDMQLDAELINVLLSANDRLRSLIDDVEASNDAQIGPELEALAQFSVPGSGELDAEPLLSTENPARTADPCEPEAQTRATGAFRWNSWHEVPGLDGAKRTHMQRNGVQLHEILLNEKDDLEAKNRTLDDLLKHACTLGDVCGSPIRDEVSADVCFIHLGVATVLDAELLAVAVELAPSQIGSISLDDSIEEVSPSQEPLPATSTAGRGSDEPETGTAAMPEGSVRSQDGEEEDLAPVSGQAIPTHMQTRWRAEETVRVRTRPLNELMETTGEMVLARNRLLRWIELEAVGGRAGGAILGRLSALTSLLQEQVTQIRLQPVGTLFGRFHRVVRDLAFKLDKEVTLSISGGDVELDRSVLEGLSDPLMHLLRNCVDHGVESPAQREQAGKPRQANIELSAHHEAGQVAVVVEDDGRGIDVERIRRRARDRALLPPTEIDALTQGELIDLLFSAGFSTADTVTEVSGRGVGLDVVRANIEALGGTVNVDTREGEGTRVVLKLPLTLAIVSSLIVEAAGMYFALPRAALEELIRLRPAEQARRVEWVSSAAVLRHRGNLLPLVRLSSVLGLDSMVHDATTGNVFADRRVRIADRRVASDSAVCHPGEKRSHEDRRKSLADVHRVLVLRVGDHKYGLMVDHIHDNEDIVVKPLSRFIRNCPCFSGTTILGDGRVSMILDPAGIANHASLRFDELAAEVATEAKRHEAQQREERVSLLLFTCGGEETFGIPLAQIVRVERTSRAALRRVGKQELLTYQDTSLPVVRLHDHLPVQSPGEQVEDLHVILPRVTQRAGLLAHRVVDSVEVNVTVDQTSISGAGILGSTTLDGRLVVLVDVFALLESAGLASSLRAVAEGRAGAAAPHVLLVEDTQYYRCLVREFLKACDCQVTATAGGEAALGLLRSTAFDVVLTDLEMPGMDGLQLLEQLRADEALRALPVVAAKTRIESRGRQAVSLAGFDAIVDKASRESVAAGVSAVLERRGRLT